MIIEIDPDGDLLITLTPPTERFALWPDDQPPVATSDDYDLEDDESATSDDLEDDKPAAPELFQYKVSSKHLSLASPRFKNMLTGTWIEATTIHPDGLRHVDIEGFHPRAFEEVMNIIHCHHDKVTKVIYTVLLAKICMVIDDLECYSAVGAFSEIWVRNLEEDIENYRDFHSDAFDSDFDRLLIMSVFISIVLEARALFKCTTRNVVLVCSMEWIPTLGLPISGKLIGMLELVFFH